MSAGNEAELEKRFLSRIQFSTAGLRGRMTAGFSMMNDVVIIQTSQVYQMNFFVFGYQSYALPTKFQLTFNIYALIFYIHMLSTVLVYVSYMRNSHRLLNNNDNNIIKLSLWKFLIAVFAA